MIPRLTTTQRTAIADIVKAEEARDMIEKRREEKRNGAPKGRD